MDPPGEPPSIRDMTPDARRAMLRRRDVAAGRAGMEIGGSTAVRRALRAGGRLLALGVVAGAFVAAFFKFTGSLRIAAIVVVLMLAYMIAIGRIVEGRAGRID